MCGDAHCIAAVPAPLDDSDGKDCRRASRKLERVWARLGFRHYGGGAGVLDPGTNELGDAVDRMRENFASR
jgi:hypothetical protein